MAGPQHITPTVCQEVLLPAPGGTVSNNNGCFPWEACDLEGDIISHRQR